uniref:Uncharacterized protein n=1 Tax=Arundo donax TaxID=35708 RepID=A0A0A8YGL0_ARUDO
MLIIFWSPSIPTDRPAPRLAAAAVTTRPTTARRCTCCWATRRGLEKIDWTKACLAAMGDSWLPPSAKLVATSAA